MTGPVTTEALVDGERTRLIAWLGQHQVSVGSAIEREATADALVADFIAPLLAALQQVTAERDEETQRANEAVIRAGAMEQERNHLRLHFDAAIAAATNDELPSNIRKTLAERVTWYRDRWLYATSELGRLWAKGEAKDRALKEIAADATQGARCTYRASFKAWFAHIEDAARTALARAATAREE